MKFILIIFLLFISSQAFLGGDTEGGGAGGNGSGGMPSRRLASESQINHGFFTTENINDFFSKRNEIVEKLISQIDFSKFEMTKAASWDEDEDVTIGDEKCEYNGVVSHYAINHGEKIFHVSYRHDFKIKSDDGCPYNINNDQNENLQVDVFNKPTAADFKRELINFYVKQSIQIKSQIGSDDFYRNKATFNVSSTSLKIKINNYDYDYEFNDEPVNADDVDYFTSGTNSSKIPLNELMKKRVGSVSEFDSLYIGHLSNELAIFNDVIPKVENLEKTITLDELLTKGCSNENK